jgi:prophage regulatory protein
MLDLSRNGLTKLRAKDPTFPRPIKFGQTKQAVVFYDANELAAWIEAKKAGRAA